MPAPSISLAGAATSTLRSACRRPEPRHKCEGYHARPTTLLSTKRHREGRCGCHTPRWSRRGTSWTVALKPRAPAVHTWRARHRRGPRRQRGPGEPHQRREGSRDRLAADARTREDAWRPAGSNGAMPRRVAARPPRCTPGARREHAGCPRAPPRHASQAPTPDQPHLCQPDGPVRSGVVVTPRAGRTAAA